MAMVGPDDILGLVPADRHEVTTNGPADTFLHLWLVPRFCPSRLPSVRGLLLVPVRADLLVAGVVFPLVNGGDGEIHWGLGGLDIGVVRFSM